MEFDDLKQVYFVLKKILAVKLVLHKVFLYLIR